MIVLWVLLGFFIFVVTLFTITQIKERKDKANRKTRTQKVADFDLTNRPLTKALLLRYARMTDELEKDLKNTYGRTQPLKEVESLEKMIDEAIISEISELIETSLKEIKREIFFPWLPIPKDAPLIFVFSILLSTLIEGDIAKEGYSAGRKKIAASVCLLLLTGHKEQEREISIMSGFKCYSLFAMDETPDTVEWKRTLVNLFILYKSELINSSESKLNSISSLPLFGKMLEFLLDANTTLLPSRNMSMKMRHFFQTFSVLLHRLPVTVC